MADVISLIGSVPNVIWSGVIAALIALAGVGLSNKANNKRLNTQLVHDASEKHKERVSDLRKEIYLQVTDEVSLACNYLATLIHGSMDDLDMRSDLKGVTTALARLVLVAETETTKISNRFGSQYGLLMMKIFQEMLPLHKLNEDIKLIDKQYTEASEEVFRLLKQINELDEATSKGTASVAALRARHIEYSEVAQRFETEQDEAYNQYREKSKVLNELLLPDIIDLSKTQLQLLIAIRQDLGVTTDAVELQRQLEHQWTVMKAGYSNTIASFDG